MAKTAELYSAHYKAIKIVPTAAAVAGDVIVENEQRGFLLEDITADEVANNEERALIVNAEQVRGIKTAAQAWAPGEPVYYDPAGPEFTNVAGVLDLVGFAREAALAADTHGIIKWIGDLEFQKT